MFEKIVEVQDFIKLYNTNGFQDRTDFEYKLTSLLIKVQNEKKPEPCRQCDDEYRTGYDEGYREGTRDGRAQAREDARGEADTDED